MLRFPLVLTSFDTLYSFMAEETIESLVVAPILLEWQKQGEG